MGNRPSLLEKEFLRAAKKNCNGLKCQNSNFYKPTLVDDKNIGDYNIQVYNLIHRKKLINFVLIQHPVTH